MIVVADTTPLVHLSRIGRLDLIALLFREVLIPRAVWSEVGGSEAGAQWVVELAGAAWLRVVDDPQLEDLGLDPGETAAILLAEAMHADLLLIDERRGRAVATERHIPIIGTVGVVGVARRRGFVERARPILEALRADGFWLSDEVMESVLAGLGE